MDSEGQGAQGPIRSAEEIDTEQMQELRRPRKQGTIIKTLMQDYGRSKASVYRYYWQHNLDADIS